jgi:hypothetical protein
MAKQQVHVSTTINKSAADVIRFVADVRNRAQYQPTLKEVSDFQGNPEEVGSSWHWKWAFGDRALEGTGRCTAYEAGKRYTFVTEGGIASTFDYQATTEGSATKLDVNVEVDVPAQLASEEEAPQLLQLAQQKGQEALGRLKVLLEK